MSNVLFLNVTKRTDNAEFLENATYQIMVDGIKFQLKDEEDNVILEDLTPDALVVKIQMMGGNAEIVKVDADEHKFLHCIGVPAEGSKFECGKYYAFYHDRLNMNDDEPFKDVVIGVDIKREDVNDDFYKRIGAVDTFRHLLKAMHSGNTPGFRLVGYKEYRKHTHPVKAAFEQKRYESYTLTDEEREMVFKGVTELLTKYDHEWSDDGVNALIDKWEENKGELISAFMAHPNYNGNFQIVFSNEFYEMSTNRHAGRELMEWVYSHFRTSVLLEEKKLLGKSLGMWERERVYLNAIMPKVTPILQGDEVVMMNYDLFSDIRQKLDKIKFIVDMFNGERYTEESMKKQRTCEDLFTQIERYTSDRVTEEFATYVNERAPEIRARAEQKTTKVVQKVLKKYGLDKEADFHKFYAKYCDAINIIKITRHTVLSLLPMDYLTMSFGNSWSSCQTIDKRNIRHSGGETYEGMHASGTVSYMLDKASFVLYTVNSKYEGSTFWEQDKINRCMFHVGNEKILQGRCYPQCEDGNGSLYTQFRVLVQKVMSELWDIPNQWIVKRSGNYGNMVWSYGTHYADYFHFGDCNMSVFKHSRLDHTVRRLDVGHTPICTNCGEEHDEDGYLACCDGARDICPECGERIDRCDDVFEYNGRRYHWDCGFYCDYHDEREPDSHRWAYVSGYGDICEDAFRYSDSFCECAECGTTFYEDDVTETSNGFVCDRCLDDRYVWIEREGLYYPEEDCVKCEHCGEWYHLPTMSDIHEYDDHWFCNSCVDAGCLNAEAV